ncbi:cyclase family protein [Nonomuraea sp. NPDC002799]
MNAEQAIAEAAATYSNWGRWGEDDVRGTLNFLTPSHRVAAARLVRKGVSFSLSQRFDTNGPQKGWRRRTNPVHTMTDTGTDAALGKQGFPHGFGGADDVIAMPLQCSTQWDGLGHIFDHGVAWNGRKAQDVVTSEGDLVTGIEHVSDVLTGRGVLLDVAAVYGSAPEHQSGGCGLKELPDGFAITEEHLASTAQAHGVEVGAGDIVCVRTGQLARVRRDGWGEYAGGPAPGLSFWSAGWLHGSEIAAIATDTWGFEVRPNEFENAFQPLHQVAIPHLGLLIGEMWDLEALAADCAADGAYAFFLTAAPLPVTGAVGSPVNPIAVK